MELRTYWNIIWKRIWVIVIIVGIVALYVGYEYYHLRKTPPSYTSTVVIQVGIQPDGQNISYADAVGASDVIAETFITSPILTSKEFDTQIVSQIQADMGQITQKYGANPAPDLGDWHNVAAIGNSLTATPPARVHNVDTLTITWSTPDGAWAIAHAIGEVTSANACTYLGYTSSTSTTCTATSNSLYARVLSDATDATTVPASQSGKLLTLLLLLVVALLAGIALAFLMDYLDDRIRGKEDATRLFELPIYGEVPRAPGVGRNTLNAVNTPDMPDTPTHKQSSTV